MTACLMTVGVGPGMLLNFHTSLRRGFSGGLAVVAGLYTSDCTIIVIELLGFSRIAALSNIKNVFGIVCGSLLLVFAVSIWLARPSIGIKTVRTGSELPGAQSMLKAFLSGFIVNISNPFVYAFWMTVMGFAVMNFGYRTRSFYIYFVTVVVTALIFDMAKSYLFSRAKSFVNPAIMVWFNRTMGLALAAAGIIIICQAYRQ